MSRSPFESEYLYGLHDPGGEQLMHEADRRGWILFTEEVGHDPAARQQNDLYAVLGTEGFGIIVRLNNGYYNQGTLPHSSQYENFARCCANFVADSPGAHIWIIGNETNLAAERPDVQIEGWRGIWKPEARDFRDILSIFSEPLRGDPVLNPGEVITPELYVRCYGLCREAIHDVAGHQDDLVLICAVAPWNINTGDWIAYFRCILETLGPNGCDGISLHTYTHGVNPDLVTSAEKMQNPEYSDRHYHFRAYQDFMNAIPGNMRHLPVYITEIDQDEAWDDKNRGWVQRAYGELNDWNWQPGCQQIRAAILYRWHHYEGHTWWIDGNQGVIDDFREAVKQAYRWNPDAVSTTQTGAKPVLSEGQQVIAAVTVNVRQTPGHKNKPETDTLGQLTAGAPGTVLGPSKPADGLVWWPVRATLSDGRTVEGWAAQAAPGGEILLRAA
jgi:hypothetical protein